MKKTKTPRKQSKHYLLLAAVVALMLIVISGLAGYGLAYQKYNPNKIPTENKPGYITADEARNQVDNFYRQYLHPKRGDPEASRKLFVSGYGSKNLAFYDQYYQHGFDPIVCSNVMPTSVTAVRVKPGMGAEVTARTTYPDGTSADIALTLVINNEGFKIDTIACPGAKGKLPPQA